MAENKLSSWLRGLGTPSPDEAEVGTVLPLARQKDGSLRMAVPEMLRTVIRGLGDANDLQATPDSINLALMGMPTAGAIAPVQRAAGETVLGTFAGRASKTANQKLAQRAEQMAIDEGSRNMDILKETGWFIGSDGLPRYEIPDKDQVLRLPWHSFPETMLPQTQKVAEKAANPSPRGWGQQLDPGFQSIPWGKPDLTVGSILDHPELFAAYPDLANIPVKSTGFNFDLRGAYDREGNTIYLGSGTPDSVNSTLHHELQHAIQQREGFTNGGNSRRFLPEGFADDKSYTAGAIKSMLDRLNDQGMHGSGIGSMLEATLRHGGDLPDFYKKYYAKEIQQFQTIDPAHQETLYKLYTQKHQQDQAQALAFERYSNLGGEVEARNVQTRLGTSPKDNTPPWETEDVPLEKQLIWNGDKLELPDGTPVPLVPSEIINILKGVGNK